MKKLKAYLAAPIFTERDRMFNSFLEKEILKRCPDLDLYLAQNNQSINDKTGCASSIDIYVGDVTRLKESDLVIGIVSGDLPSIGSSYELAYYCALCEQDYNKTIIALYDDCRDGSQTYSEAKRDAMLTGLGENQWSYINLLAVGYLKKWGTIYNTSAKLIDAIEQWYYQAQDERLSGIYKITNLKNNLVYIGQTVNFGIRRRDHWSDKTNDDLHNDIQKLGREYFKFEIIEKCDVDQLDEREKYWIEYYDSYNMGYNNTEGGSGNKLNAKNSQCMPVYAYNLDGTFAAEYYSIASAMRELNMKSNNITRCIIHNDNHHHSGGFMWKTYKTDQIPAFEKNLGGKSIYCYDLNTRLFVKEYKTVTEAGIELCGKRTPHICSAANGSRKSACGFLWSYEKFERLPDDYQGAKRSLQKVYAYDMKTREFVKEYPNAYQAEIQLNGNKNKISDVILGLRKSWKGFLWSYEKYDILPLNKGDEYHE